MAEYQRPDEAQKAYLRGKRYLGEKLEPHRPSEKEGAQNEHLKTSERIAEELGVGQATIRRDAKYAEALDTLANCEPDRRRWRRQGWRR